MSKVLVIDDDQIVLGVVQEILLAAGHQVWVTSDPSEVCELAFKARPEAIVLDVMMPKASGYEVMEMLRMDPRVEDVPVLFLSGLGEASDRVKGLRSGADDYLVKPFEPAELVLRIERLVNWHLASGEWAPAPGVRDKLKKAEGQRFGRYRVIEKIGQGHMGTVFKGHDPRLQRQVALKTIRLDSTSTDSRRRELLELLRHEAVTIAKLSHPNVVAVYDMGETKDSAYVAMELVDGVSLSDYLAIKGPMKPRKIIPLAVGIARGLALTHARQVIHRDMKPGNVLLGRDGAIKVSDFGLASVVSSLFEDSTELSGTPGYVPPEVLNQRAYTEKGDLFGLGAVLYESIAGRHPLAGETLRDTILNTLHGRIQPLGERMPDLPKNLDQLIGDLLAIDPDRRPTAPQVVARLEEMIAREGLRWDPSDLPQAE